MESGANAVQLKGYRWCGRGGDESAGREDMISGSPRMLLLLSRVGRPTLNSLPYTPLQPKLLGLWAGPDSLRRHTG